MPLTEIQKTLGRLLASNRSEDSYLAGGAALLSEPNTQRYSQDLDYFHDSPARVASAYESDKITLQKSGYTIQLEINQPGYLRAFVSKKNSATKIEWARDSSWRFMPVEKSKEFGYRLHPIDLSTNKVLALAGRDEPRDLLDTLYIHRTILKLGPLVWAATGKDPGFSPQSLLELLKRRGKIHPEELNRLNLSETPDVKQLKMEWLKALQGAETFIHSRPAKEAGCLYYSTKLRKFSDPGDKGVGKVTPHYGRPRGILPKIIEQD